MSGVTARKPDWGAIWTAIQELGYALSPIVDAATPPQWATTLRKYLDIAEIEAEEHYNEEAVSGE